jgi:hypothetical protein
VSPTQIKLAIAGAMALIAWLLTTRATSTPAGRVSRELDVDANVLSPYFGMTDEEIAAAKAAGVRPNPALDPTMRDLIDVSNVLIAADDA